MTSSCDVRDIKDESCDCCNRSECSCTKSMTILDPLQFQGGGSSCKGGLVWSQLGSYHYFTRKGGGVNKAVSHVTVLQPHWGPKGGQNFFFELAEGGGTRNLLCMPRGGGPEKIGDLQSQTDGPPPGKKLWLPKHISSNPIARKPPIPSIEYFLKI